MNALRGVRRIAPPASSCSRTPCELLPEDPGEQDEQDDGADRDQDDQALVVVEEAELDREGAADREEEVEVDGDVEDREGDLLHRERREHHREGRAGEQGGEHDQHHPGADVGRQEAVHRDGRRVAGEDEAERDVGAGEGGAQDPEPGERGERRLRRLQDDPGGDRPGRQLAELVEELVDPVVDRDPEQVEDEDEQGDAADPGGDPRQPPVRTGGRSASAPARLRRR